MTCDRIAYGLKRVTVCVFSVYENDLRSRRRVQPYSTVSVPYRLFPLIVSAECRCLDYFWCCQKNILPAVAPQTGQNIRNVAPPAHGFCAWAHHRNIANPILVSVSQYNTLSGLSSRSLLSSAELSYQYTKYMTAHGTKYTTATAAY